VNEGEIKRVIAEALYAIIFCLTLAVGLALVCIFLVTPPMMPIEFVKVHWNLYAALVLGVGALSYAHKRLWGKR
jgi:hypothetical protein